MSNPSFKVEKSGDVEFTLTYTLNLRQWQVVSAGLSKGSYHHATADLNDAIRDMTHQATQVFQPEAKDGENKPVE